MFKFSKVLISTAILCIFLFVFPTLVFASSSKTLTITGSNVNMRNGPGSNYRVVGRLDKGQKVSYLGKSGAWYKVKTSKGGTAWVSSSYISSSVTTASRGNSLGSTSTKTLTITGSNVNIRSGPGTNYKVVGKVDKGQKVSYLGKSGAWYKINVSKVGAVWVNKAYISSASSYSSTTSRGDLTNRSAELSVGDKIISIAKNYLGVPYVWGGSSPSGFDCSGFAKYIFGKFGVTLDHLASDQATAGTYVSKSNLRKGDLVFFDTHGNHSNINHVGIYIGDGKFIQSSSARSGVIISDLSSGFYANNYMTARRVI